MEPAPGRGYDFTGQSYDNTRDLGASIWRHVAFIECDQANTAPTPLPSDDARRRTGRLEACPTGAIMRTEFGSVYIQPDACNGCSYCVPACLFGVPQVSESLGISRKCTLCYDRLAGGVEPARAPACPTDSIVLGPLDELRERADDRAATTRAQGIDQAHVYGDGHEGGTDGLHSLFVLTAPPEVYNLPAQPELTGRRMLPGLLATGAMALGLGWPSRRRSGERSSAAPVG